MLQDYFTQGYDFLVVPKVVREVSIGLSKMMREDGTYHSIATLEVELGSLFMPIDIIDDRFMLVHFSFDRNGEDVLFDTFAQANGLVPFRGNLEAVSAIDFTILNGNEYGIFSAREVGMIPKIETILR